MHLFYLLALLETSTPGVSESGEPLQTGRKDRGELRAREIRAHTTGTGKRESERLHTLYVPCVVVVVVVSVVRMRE